MMRLLIFTDGSAIKKYFSGIESSRSWDLQFSPHEDLRRIMKKMNDAELYLFDYASAVDETRQKDLNYFLKKTDAATGVIDRKNEILDPAAMIMKGTDYLGGGLLKEGIKAERLNKSIEFHRRREGLSSTDEEAPAEEDKKQRTKYIIPEGGWKGVKSGHEYTFLMLFTEISIPADLKKKSGKVHLNQLKQIFQSVVEREIEPYDGRVWIWNEYGGLVLFPFDGESAEAVIPAVKLMLNRVLISVEDFQLHSSINLRSAIHLGTSIYKARGKTGTIISDSINSIFHLGTKYTPQDDLDITAEVYDILPERVQTLFIRAGIFEGRDIFRLRHFEVHG